MSAYLRANFPGILTEASSESFPFYAGKYKMESIELSSTDTRPFLKNTGTDRLTRDMQAKPKPLETNALDITSLVAKLYRVIILSLFFLMIVMGFAIFLGELMGKPYYGFFIVALAYLLGGVLLHYYLSPGVKKWLRDFLIK